VLLLDEPFGALDALTRLRMQDLLLEIHAAEPTTVLVVTHDVEEALYLADRVLLLRSLRASDQVQEGLGSLARTVEVPGVRPRDRADSALAALRVELLEGLGVHAHPGPAQPADPAHPAHPAAPAHSADHHAPSPVTTASENLS
jgi:sulfonate transport system ATP-binding protein